MAKEDEGHDEKKRTPSRRAPGKENEGTRREGVYSLLVASSKTHTCDQRLEKKK